MNGVTKKLFIILQKCSLTPFVAVHKHIQSVETRLIQQVNKLLQHNHYRSIIGPTPTQPSDFGVVGTF